MDYQGQRDAERISQIIIVLGFVLGTGYGWWVQSLLFALYGWLAGLAVAFLVCVPSWPHFRRHPIKWLPDPTPDSDSGEEEGEDDRAGDDDDEKKAPVSAKPERELGRIVPKPGKASSSGNVSSVRHR